MINWQEDNRQSSVPIQADVLVQGQDGFPIALVEVKNRQGLTAEIAKGIRRNLVTHGFILQKVPYFLVVSQDAGFLWIQRPPFGRSDPPSAEFPMRPVISHYVRWLATDERLSGSALEIVVANWLADESIGRGPILSGTTESLGESGFLGAIRGATVRINERV